MTHIFFIWVCFRYGEKGLHEILQNCDYVISILPSTPETRGMLSSDKLSHCKEVNKGRECIQKCFWWGDRKPQRLFKSTNCNGNDCQFWVKFRLIREEIYIIYLLYLRNFAEFYFGTLTKAVTDLKKILTGFGTWYMSHNTMWLIYNNNLLS